MDWFATFPEQAEAKRLLGAALEDGPAHAYLLHGPAGVGKRAAALASTRPTASWRRSSRSGST